MDMSFTYEAYCNMVDLLHRKNYKLVGYKDSVDQNRCAILRHDVDTSLKKAVEMAEFEAKKGVKSTYFILLTTDFYNAASVNGQESIRKLCEFGHDIGLHFDETLYPELSSEELAKAIRREADILSHLCHCEIASVSMHRPSKRILESDFVIPGLINAYGKTYFRDYKYVSDSRRNWREPVLDIISSEKYDQLHILTHPFWYFNTEHDLHETVEKFVNSANRERYAFFKDNITSLEEIMKESEVR